MWSDDLMTIIFLIIPLLGAIGLAVVYLLLPNPTLSHEAEAFIAGGFIISIMMSYLLLQDFIHRIKSHKEHQDQDQDQDDDCGWS